MENSFELLELEKGEITRFEKCGDDNEQLISRRKRNSWGWDL